MRSVLSNLVFVAGFILAVWIGGYFMLRGGVLDAISGVNSSNPITWLEAAGRIVLTILITVATVISILIVSAISLLIDKDNSLKRKLAVKWQNKADARYWRRSRNKTRN